MSLDDTIVAIATPPGRGGIGVVRLSGSESRPIAQSMLRLKHDLEPGRAIVCDLLETTAGMSPPAAGRTGADFRPVQPEHGSKDLINPTDATRIDEVVVTYFAKPHSYTTDDVVEISAHGSPVVLRQIVEQALTRRARLAEPGEFTMRAFLNGRIDLTQAEAVRDLIESQTLYQARVAARQLEGALSRRLQPAKQRLVELIATLEAGIDFAEDDISVLPANRILEQIDAIQAPLGDLSSSFAYGKIVHEGFTLAIVGRPNVGKSSLFNRLVEQERAIVTATPGTTRDPVSETVAIGGIPVKLIDTAGIRRALDEAESIGIRKSMEALADADLVLIVLDCSQAVTAEVTAELIAEDQELIAQVSNGPAILVENKADLSRSAHPAVDTTLPRVSTSALTGEGIPELRAEILRHVGGDFAAQSETGFITSLRHQKLIDASITALDAARKAIANRIPHEMLLLDLYSSLRPLDEITGATTTDDILNLIFSKFCIGK